MTADFTLGPTTGGPRLLGVWTDTTMPSDVTFSSTARSSTTAVTDPRWRVELPPDRAAAGRLLRLAYERLHRSDAALSSLLYRLTRDGVADTSLLDVDDGTEGPTVDPGDRLRGASDVLDLVRRSCAPTAWVETCQDARPFARSRMTVSGRVSTVVLDGAADLVRHRDSVLLTAATRATALQALAVTARCAVALVVTLSLPGGPLLALPLAWRLVQQAIAVVTRPTEGAAV